MRKVIRILAVRVPVGGGNFSQKPLISYKDGDVWDDPLDKGETKRAAN